MPVATIEQTIAPPRVTPYERQQKKRKAAELLTLAYLPQPVKQTDGTTLHLCWWGRLARAYNIVEAEPDPGRQDLLRQAVQRLEAQAQAAMDAAEAAMAEYIEACQSASFEPNYDLVPPCQCDACVTADKARTFLAAYEI